MVSYPEHLAGFDYRGFHRYFLTFCTFERRPYFCDAAKVGVVSEQILRIAARTGFAVPAYCFMPDHVHLLAEGTEPTADLKRMIKVAKQHAGFYFTRQHHVPLWQRYGFERVLRSDEATLAVARYIIENPLRAGLVRTLSEYPFLGSSLYTREQLIEYVQDGQAT